MKQILNFTFKNQFKKFIPFKNCQPFANKINSNLLKTITVLKNRNKNLNKKYIHQIQISEKLILSLKSTKTVRFIWRMSKKKQNLLNK